MAARGLSAARVGLLCAAILALTPVCGPQVAAGHQGHGVPVHAHNPLPLVPRAAAGPLGRGTWPIYGKDLSNSRNAGDRGPSSRQARRLGSVWSFASSAGGFNVTPVVADGTLVAGSRDGKVFALDAATGKLRWSRNFHERIFASAAIVGGRVFVPLWGGSTHPSVVALRLRDGSPLWKTVIDTQQGADLYSSPVVAQGTLYIGTSGGTGEHEDANVRARGSVVALDARTGRLRWKTYTVPPGYDGGGVITTAAVDLKRRRLFVGTGNAYHEPAASTTDAILSLSTVTGRVTGTFQATSSDIYTHPVPTGPDVDFGASPNLIRSSSGRSLVGEAQKSHVYWALDSRTMRRVWNRRMSTTRRPRYPETLASTAYDGRRVYGQTDDGQVWGLSPGGRREWITKPSGKANYSPMAVANGVVYSIRWVGFMTVRRATTGSLLARIPLGSRCFGGVTIAGGSVFVATGDENTPNGYIVAYRPRP